MGMGDRGLQKSQRFVARKPMLSMSASKRVVAGGHHFLDQYGGATVILASGALTGRTIKPNDARMVA